MSEKAGVGGQIAESFGCLAAREHDVCLELGNAMSLIYPSVCVNDTLGRCQHHKKAHFDICDTRKTQVQNSKLPMGLGLTIVEKLTRDIYSQGSHF